MSMTPLLLALALIAAYLLGGFSLSLLLVRARLGRDVRQLGSGNPGATNVLGLLGASPAVLVLLSDVGKGVLAVVAARGLGLAGAALGWVALAAVTGHVFPLTHGLRGGKGVATTLGAFGMLVPWATLAALVVFVVAVVVTRYVAVGSVLAALTLPVATLASGWWSAGATVAPASERLTVASCAALAALLVSVRHHANGRRMLAGTETRIGERRRRNQAS